MLSQLLRPTYGRTLEATGQQANIMINAASNYASVHMYLTLPRTLVVSVFALLQAGAEVVHTVTTWWLVPDMTSHTISRTRVKHCMG